MINTIVFKVRNFPRVSETFVVSNIVASIKKGYQVNIITENKFLSIDSPQKALFEQYGLESITASFLQITSKPKRYILALYYLLNPVLLYYFVKFCLYKKGLSLRHLFYLRFYKPYRKSKIIHIHFANSAEDIPILKKIGFIKSKVIITFHGFDAYFKNKSELNDLKNKYSLLFNIASWVTINTLYLKDKVLAIGCPEDKLKVVPVGIDTDFFKPIAHPKSLKNVKTFNVISIGRLIEIKGHEYGIRAIKLLVDKGYNVFYRIIGDGVLYEKLNEIITELGLQQHVKLHGKANQEDIKGFLEESHFFLMTSVKDSTRREESQGIVTAEAQAMGVPVLGFKSGGIPFTVSDKTGVLVEEKDIKKLSDCMIELINDKNKYSTMSTEARKLATSRFNLPAMVESYYNDF